MDQYLNVRVRAVRRLTGKVNEYELEGATGALPPFEAGAHVNVLLGEGCVRSYSLCNDPAERHRYVIAVKREDDGRGGSLRLHETARAGARLQISAPRNTFPLRPGAATTILIAGGIGITPLLPMLRVLLREGRAAELHVCTRSREETPFLAELSAEPLARHVRLHHDEGDPSRGLKLEALLSAFAPGTVAYCCGPEGLMSEVRRHTEHWPQGSVHFESFAPAAPRAARVDAPFEVKIQSTGEVLAIPADQSLLHVLLENGVYLESSCEQGSCGTCAFRVLEGVPDHRDSALSDEEHAAGKMTPCVSRACSRRLLLDL